MNWFKYLKFTTGQSPSSLFPTKKILLKNFPTGCSVCCMAPFFNMFSISTCIKCACSWPMCGVWRTLSCVGCFRKGILNYFIISKISGFFVSPMLPKNVLTCEWQVWNFSCREQAFYLWMNIPQIFYWNFRRKQDAEEEGFLCVYFYLGIHCFSQLLGSSFCRIFFVSTSHCFCRGRILIVALKKPFSVLLNGHFERSFVFSFPFKQIFECSVFLFSWSHQVFAKLFSRQIPAMPLQQICLLPQHFFGLLCWAVEGC